jgi:hypothetical protein
MKHYVISNGYRIVIPYLYTSILKVKDSEARAIEVHLHQLSYTECLTHELAYTESWWWWW